jgi:BMFP domain-containing protein YqiC
MNAIVLAVCVGALSGVTIHAQNPNTAYGTGALASSEPNLNNSAFGFEALYSNTSGFNNTATGETALYSNTTGSNNSATGQAALSLNTTGGRNTAIGEYALSHNNGSYNSAIGSLALAGNTTGSGNTAMGYLALNQANGSDNTAIGEDALPSARGSYNIAIGAGSGGRVGTGSYNIAIGNQGTSSDSGVIRIGTASQQTSFYAAGIDGVQISSGVPVYINSNGQLGTVNSSIRFKENVRNMADASNKIFELRPVTYRYKQAYEDGSKPVDYGLIAEEVAQVYPDMVARDASGEIQTVQYQKLTPMLLNEVQKQHLLLKTQQQAIDTLEQRISALEATLDSAKSKALTAAE